MEQREYIVEAEGAGQRIDRFLSGEDTGLSRSALQGLVAEGHVLCNGKAPAKSLKLKAGDIILLEIPDAKPIEAVPQEIPLDIVYEDAHLLVVNKPKGMVVHPAPGNNGMAFVDIAIPCGNIFFPIFWSDDLDSSFRTCCRIELKEGKSCNETVHLLIEFFNRNAFTLQL